MDIVSLQKTPQTLYAVKNETTLYAECLRGNWNNVKQMLDGGDLIDLDVTTDDERQTPLMITCLRGKKDIVEKMLDSGANIEATDIWGQTPLFFAIGKEIEVVKLLVSRGANIDTSDKENGWTPIIIASMHGDVDSIDYLHLHGADIDVQDKLDGWNSMIYAASENNIETVKKLYNLGANPHIKDKNGKTFLDFIKDEKVRSDMKEYITVNIKRVKKYHG